MAILATMCVNIRAASYDVYIGRGSKWGNPFRIGRDGTREDVIIKYRKYIRSQPHLIAALHELKGRRLGCYCSPLACHGDILVKLVKKHCFS